MNRKILYTNWNLPRIIRLVLSMMILIQGFIIKDMVLLSGGVIFLITALLNIGCCGAGNCPVNYSSKEIRNIEYEKVDHSK